MIISIDGIDKVVNDIKITTHDGMMVELHETNETSDSTNMTVQNSVATYRIEKNRLTHVLPEGHTVDMIHA